MTEKQRRILEVALRLFAEEGYNAVPTSRVAKEAGVSEGLIFRHFQSKEGLLQAIMEEGKQRAEVLYAPILKETSPLAAIRAFLLLPFQIPADQYHFWRLLYSLKWQANAYDDTLSAPVKTKLIEAFRALGAANPEAEADLLLLYIDGAATTMLLHPPQEAQKEALKEALLAKYSFD